MKGFFDIETTQIPYKSNNRYLSCVSCGLYKTAKHPKLKPYGDFQKQIMVIGDAPGREEDIKGIPWQGKAGRILQQTYRRLGVDLFKDCININAINCIPVGKDNKYREPTEYEVDCCRQKIISTIKKYKPKVIIIHGNQALSSLLGYRWRKNLGGIIKWRGWAIPDMDYNAWVCPTFHPAFIEQQQEQNETQVIWEKDLKQAFSKINEPFPYNTNFKDAVKIIYDGNKVLKKINRLQPKYLAFDIETTGLKPYNKKVHQIVCISFCYDENLAFSIPMPQEKEGLQLLKQILENPRIGKIAANLKYENNWMYVMHGIDVSPWKFDTMQATHILDNRPGITSLKFQSFVQFGVYGYDNDIAQFLRSADSNTPNKVIELTKTPTTFDKLLLYCGIDSLMTYRLALKQMKEVGF